MPEEDIKNYIKKELEVGHSSNEIYEHLRNKGYNHQTLDSAIRAVNAQRIAKSYAKINRQRIILYGGISLFSFIIFVIILIIIF